MYTQKPKSRILNKQNKEGKTFNRTGGKPGHLSKDGLIYQNTLMQSDSTDQRGLIKKIR